MIKIFGTDSKLTQKKSEQLTKLSSDMAKKFKDLSQGTRFMMRGDGPFVKTGYSHYRYADEDVHRKKAGNSSLRLISTNVEVHPPPRKEALVHSIVRELVQRVIDEAGLTSAQMDRLQRIADGDATLRGPQDPVRKLDRELERLGLIRIRAGRGYEVTAAGRAVLHGAGPVRRNSDPRWGF
jgi:hypothetical protein